MMSPQLKKDDLWTLWIHGCFVAPISDKYSCLCPPTRGYPSRSEWISKDSRLKTCNFVCCRCLSIFCGTAWLGLHFPLSLHLPSFHSVSLPGFFPSLFLSVRLYLRLPPCRPFHFAIAKEIVNTARCRKYIIIRWRTGENKSRHVCGGGMWDWCFS